MSFYDKRPAVLTDYGKIIESWANGCRQTSRIHRWDALGYKLLLTKAIRDLLDGADVRARVACDMEDPDVILGFVVSTGSVLHFAWVRDGFRRKGIVPDLLDGVTVESYSFRTDPGMRRLKPAARGWTYTPHVAEFCDGKVKVEIAA